MLSYNLILLFFGLILVVKGADILVSCAISIGKKLNLSELAIGIVIVGFGTSLSELLVSIDAVINNAPDLSLGNIIGSNIANILLILGLISIFKDIEFGNQKEKKNETVWVLIITIIVVGTFVILTETQSSSPVTIYVGVGLICMLLAYLVYEFLIQKDVLQEDSENIKSYSQIISYLFLLIGLILLIAGSFYFVLGSKNLAIAFEIPEAIIGFTLVAFGTSLPELATGIIAAIKKQTKLAVGTILGSNVYNIVGIFAVILLAKGDEFPSSIDLYLESLLFMSFVTILFTLKIRKGFKIGGLYFRPYRIGRKTGIIFVLLYFAYVIYSYSGI